MEHGQEAPKGRRQGETLPLVAGISHPFTSEIPVAGVHGYHFCRGQTGVQVVHPAPRARNHAERRKSIQADRVSGGAQ